MLQQLARLTEKQLDDFCEQLIACTKTLRTLPLVACGYVGSDEGLEAVSQFTDTFATRRVPQAFVPWRNNENLLVPAVGRREFCVLNTQVSSCIRMLEAPHFSDPSSVPLMVLSRLLSIGYLWDEVRAKGGAYGVGFSYQPYSRHACLQSSEDPQAGNTFRVFDEIAEFVRHHTFSSTEVGQAVLSVAGSFLRPDRPQELCSLAVKDLLMERSDDLRQQDFERLMAVTPEEVHATAVNFFNPATMRFNDCAAGPAEAAVAVPEFLPILLKA